MKKILSFVLAVVMAFSLGVSAIAAPIELKPAPEVKNELIELNMLELNADNESIVMAGKGGTYYLMLDPTVNYTNVSVTASGNVDASIVAYDAEKYEAIPGLTYGVWNRNAGDWVETNLTYDYAKGRAKDLNMEHQVTYYEMRPEGYANIFILEIADNFGRSFAEGKLVIKAYNEDLDRAESATVKVIRDVSIFGYEKVKYAAKYDKVLDQTYTGYSDYWTEVNGYDTNTVYSTNPTVISSTAFRAIAGEDISVEMAGMIVDIKDVVATQKGVNFAAYPVQKADYDKDGEVDAVIFGFYGDQVINSKFELVVDTGYTWFSLRELFGVRLEEDDVVNYTVLKDDKFYCEFVIDYSEADYNAPVRLIIDGKAGDTLGEYEIVVAEDVEIPVEPEVEGETNPNTGAPVGFFGWLFSLIFG